MIIIRLLGYAFFLFILFYSIATFIVNSINPDMGTVKICGILAVCFSPVAVLIIDRMKNRYK